MTLSDGTQVVAGFQSRSTSNAKQNLILQKSTGTHDAAHRKRQVAANKRTFDADSITINCDGRDGLLYVLGRDNQRLDKWRLERGALVFPDWNKGELVIGGKDEVRSQLRNEIYELIEDKEVSEYYIPHVVNMSLLVGHNCSNLKHIERKTDTFLRPKGSHKTIMIAGQERVNRETAKKMLKDLCGNLYPTVSSHLLIHGNVPRTATVVFMDRDYGYIPPNATGRHAKVLGIEEGQAFLEDTEDNKLCLSDPYPDSCRLDGAMQQARPLGSLLQTNSEFIQQCLFHFLNEVRPHKGLITLRGMYGKIMFLDLNEDVSSVCWRIEEFAYQSMLFNIHNVFSTRCELMEDNIADKLGGTIEECYIRYELKMIDKSVSIVRDKSACRNVLLSCRHADDSDLNSKLEIVNIVSDDLKQKEFTRQGELNNARTERFTASLACVDRKVDFRMRLECRRVVPPDNFARFVDQMTVSTEENATNPSLNYELEPHLNVLSVNKITDNIVCVGSVKVNIEHTIRGVVDKDNGTVKFDDRPVCTIGVSSKVWEGAFDQNVAAGLDEEQNTKMTWSAEQLLTKDLEDYMNVVQNASKYVKPE